MPASNAIGHGHDGRMESSLESIAIGHNHDGRMQSSRESFAAGHDDDGSNHATITAKKRNITMASLDSHGRAAN